MKRLSTFFLKEVNMMWAIALNAVLIFILSFPAYEKMDFLLALDNLFIVFFCIEAIVKIRAWGWKPYIADNWNRFDFALVLLSLPIFLVWLEKYGAGGLQVPEFFKNVIILRLLRLLRIFKAVQFIPNMDKLISGLVRALKASTFVLFVLLIFIVILAIFSCHLYGDILPEHFDNPMSSAYTIFQMFTVEGWYEIPDKIAENSSDFVAKTSRLFFIAVVLLGGVFGMSLANAIFVDEMTADNTDELEKKVDDLAKDIKDIKDALQSK